jgi:hypothetical protein
MNGLQARIGEIVKLTDGFKPIRNKANAYMSERTEKEVLAFAYLFYESEINMQQSSYWYD